MKKKQTHVWILSHSDGVVGVYLSKPTRKQLLELVPSTNREDQREMLAELNVEKVDTL